MPRFAFGSTGAVGPSRVRQPSEGHSSSVISASEGRYFYRQDFDGPAGRTLLNHPAEVGGALIAPAITFDGATPWKQLNAANHSLQAIVLDGAGAAYFNETVEYDDKAIFRLPVPPIADYFLETTVNFTPYDDDVRVMLLGRCSINDAGNNFVGFVFYVHNFSDAINVSTFQGSDGSTDLATVYTTPHIYGSGTGAFTFTYRMEVSGNKLRAKINGVVVYQTTMTDHNFTIAGDAYMGYFFHYGNYYNAKLLSMGASTFPASSIEVVEEAVLSESTSDSKSVELWDAPTIAGAAAELAVSFTTDETAVLDDAASFFNSFSVVETAILADATSQGGTFTNLVDDAAILNDALSAAVSSVAAEAAVLDDATSIAVDSGTDESAVLDDATTQTGTYGNSVDDVAVLDDATQLAVASSTNDDAILDDAFSLVAETVSTEAAVLSDVVSHAGAFTNSAIDAAVLDDAIQVGPETLTVEAAILDDASEQSGVYINNVDESAVLDDGTIVTKIAEYLVDDAAVLDDAYTSTLVATNLAVETAFLASATQGAGAPGAWTTHLETFAMSRYTEFPFNSAAIVDGVLIACGDDAVYRLDAATDAGAPIAAAVIHDWSDQTLVRGEMVSTSQFKHPRSFYASGTTDGQVSVAVRYVVSGVEASATYDLPLKTQAGFVTNRAALGRGIRSRYLGFTISNKNGSSMVINDAHAEVDLAQRTV